MDPFGAVVGLGHIFTASLEAADKVKDYKHFKADSAALATQFKAHRLRFEKWGKSVGLDRGAGILSQDALSQDALSEDHHEALDNPEVLETVTEILSLIQRICDDQDDGSLPDPSPSRPPDPSPTNRSLARTMTEPFRGVRSMKKRVSWMVKNKEKKIAQVAYFGTLVQQLHDLVSDSSSEAPASHVPQDLQEFRRVLERLDEEVQAEVRRELHAWLVRYSPTEIYDESVQRRLSNTCDWILDRPEFLGWLSPMSPQEAAKARLLWINGPAGFGKTVLCARLVEFLSGTFKSPVVHFFFSSDFESRDDPYEAIRSWISQVIAFNEVAFDHVRMRRESMHEQVATRAIVLQIFQEVVQIVPGCVFAIDGLDECALLDGRGSTGRGDSIVTFLEKLGHSIANYDARILIVSRDEPEIRCGIESTKVSVSEYKIVAEDVQGDVKLYSRSIVEKKLSKKSESLKNGISEKMAERCGGQFLWLKMQEDALRSWKNQKQLEDAIDKTPPSLDSLYQRNWARILQLPEAERDRAFSLLRWAAFAVNPLSVREIAEAVLIDLESDELALDEMPDDIDDDYINSEILGPCGSLLNLRQKHEACEFWTVRLAHFSVKEYFLSHSPTLADTLRANEDLRSSNERAEHTVLARLCLRYILSGQTWDPEADMAFRPYAAFLWHRHVHLGDPSDEVVSELIFALFDEENEIWNSWRQQRDSIAEGLMADVEAQGFRVAKEVTSGQIQAVSPLYYASSLNLTETTIQLIGIYENRVDETSISGETALLAACKHGNETAIRSLIKVGANVNIADFQGETPLHSIALGGHAKLAQLLLENGADAMATDIRKNTPLHCAASLGHVDMAGLLLKRGVDILARDADRDTPLHISAVFNHVGISELLLSEGADLESKNAYGQTPLNVAAIRGHVDATRLFLEKGADPSTTDEDELTPLHCAAHFGFMEVLHLLLDRGVDIAVRDYLGYSVVMRASMNGHCEMVDFLLKKGADPNVPSDTGCTPLYDACWKGNTELVRVLLENGADTTIGAEGGVPLTRAAIDGHIEIVRLLLEHGADSSVKDEDNDTPLSLACEHGDVKIVQLLLDHGADASMTNGLGLNPLQMAIENDQEEIIRLLPNSANPGVTHIDQNKLLKRSVIRGNISGVRRLVANGADPMAEDHNGERPLSWAAYNGHVDIIYLLVDLGCNIMARDHDGWTPLHCAATRGNVAAARACLEKGADAAALDTIEQTPLHLAAAYGHTGVVGVLLEVAGLNLNQSDSYGRTALFYAAMRGNYKVVQLLLSKHVDVNIKDRYEATALFAAARNGQAKVVEKLLANEKIPLDARDSFGKTISWWAQKSGNPRMMELIRKRATERGVHIQDNYSVPVVEQASAIFDEKTYWCDVCIRVIQPHHDYYECHECHDGNCIACEECFAAGAKCLVNSHTWRLAAHPSDIDGEDK